MLHLRDDADIAAAVAGLLAVEPRFAGVVAAHGHPPLRRVDAGLEALLRIVTDQLISLAAGAAIWRRVAADLAPFDPETILSRDEDALMRLGLSRAKARCFRELAAAVAARRLDFESLHSLPDTQALLHLTALKGIGDWTAGIYLLSALSRSDAFAAGDIALQSAAQHLFGLEERPAASQLIKLAEPWRPWRAVAARLLWSHYRGLRGMAQAVT